MKNLHIFMVCAGLIGFNLGAYADDSGLVLKIQTAKSACSGISDKMSDMKTMAGINTAVTGVGTVAGGVALGTGIAKANVDSKIEDWEHQLEEMIKKENESELEWKEVATLSDAEFDKLIESIQSENAGTLAKGIRDETEKSKTLGNIRTGTMAGATVTNAVGTIIAANNRVGDDLESKISLCNSSIKSLKNDIMRARVENTATESELAMANKIVSACSDWANVDLSSIDKRANGAAISGGISAVLGLAGTVTSASANSSSVRDDNSDSGKQKEKNLNTASNVLAGGTTVASLTSTIFNATQIGAIKKAVAAADKCEEALR